MLHHAEVPAVSGAEHYLRVWHDTNHQQSVLVIHHTISHSQHRWEIHEDFLRIIAIVNGVTNVEKYDLNNGLINPGWNVFRLRLFYLNSLTIETGDNFVPLVSGAPDTALGTDVTEGDEVWFKGSNVTVDCYRG